MKKMLIGFGVAAILAGIAYAAGPWEWKAPTTPTIGEYYTEILPERRHIVDADGNAQAVFNRRVRIVNTDPIVDYVLYIGNHPATLAAGLVLSHGTPSGGFLDDDACFDAVHAKRASGSATVTTLVVQEGY